MARRKVVTETISEDADLKDQADAEIAMAPDAPMADELADLLGVDDDGTKYTVHKQPQKPGERIAYCMTYTKSDLSLDTIRATFGGGTYRITGRDSKNQYVQSKLVTLFDMPKVPNAAGSGANADLAAVLAAAKAGGNDMMPLIMEMIRSQGAQTAAMLTAMATNKPVAPSGPTFMEIMALMKEMNHKPDGESPVKMLLEGLALGQKLSGGGGEVGMLDVAKQGLEMLSPLIARDAATPRPNGNPRPMPQQPRPNAPVQPVNGAAPQLPAAPAPSSTPVPEVPNPMFQKLNWLKALTANLVVHAVKEHDPETYAEVVLDNLPPFITEDEILERLSPDNSVALLATLNPDVAKYPVWFEEFRQAVIRFLTEEDGPPEDFVATPIEGEGEGEDIA
jgi:hypothetical protein